MKKSSLYLVCLFAVWYIEPQASRAQWLHTGNFFDTANCLVLGPSGTPLYAGSWIGGVSPSTDNGEHWNAAYIGLTASPIRALLAITAEGGGTNLYAATFGCGIFVSTDNGLH